MKRGVLSTVAVSAVAAMGVATVHASTVDLSVGLSKAQISYGSTSFSSVRSGAEFLYRDGGGDKIQDLVQQTYFYRLGNSGAATEINSLPSEIYGSPSSSSVTLHYSAAQFDMYVTYSLLGSGGTGFASTLQHSVNVVAKSGFVGQALSLWSYSDYTLTGVSQSIPTAGADYVDNNIEPNLSSNPNGFEFAQSKTVGGVKQVSQWDTYGSAGNTTISLLTNKFTSGAPATVETSTASALLSKLTSGSPDLTQSSGVTGGQNGDGTAVDVAFAAQWNLLLSGGAGTTVVESSAIIPEPATLGMLALGAGMLAFPRRRKVAR